MTKHAISYRAKTISWITVIAAVMTLLFALPIAVSADPPAFAPQTDLNNMIGKAVTGYQAWFSARPGTGSGGSGGNWHHWEEGAGNGRPPGVGTTHVEIWPDVRDYERNNVTLHKVNTYTGSLANLNLGNLGDGREPMLFNSRDAGVILTHFEWMRDYGIDGAAVQRFRGSNDATSNQISDANNHLIKIREAAELTDRIFYVMYDMSGSYKVNNQIPSNLEAHAKSLVDLLKADMEKNVEKVTASTHYAHADGKPVICIWGIHANEEDHWMPIDAVVPFVQWLQDRGYYVIGGTPDGSGAWDTVNDTNRPEKGRDMYAMCDMLSPWMVGRYDSSPSGPAGWMANNIRQGLEFCEKYRKANGDPIDFQPGVWPGFGWTNMGNIGEPNSHPRRAGQFVWDQAYPLLKNYGVKNFYLAMFDEYDEGTAWMKAGVDYFDIPTNQYFLTMATDGTWVSSDYYLRTAGAVAEMLKGTRALTAEIDIPHSIGPVYWRNSFERRDGRAKLYAEGSSTVTVTHPRPNLAIDVGVPDGKLIAERTSGIAEDGLIHEICDDYDAKNGFSEAKSGIYSFVLEGNLNAANARLTYQIAETKIAVSNDLVLRFSLYPQNELGRNAFVDLLFDDGSWLSDSPAADLVKARGTAGSWTDAEVYLGAAFKGKTITGVAAAYKGTAGSGNFAALIDDIFIEDAYKPVKTLIEIYVSAPPAKKSYLSGQPFDPAGMVVNARYNDNSTAVITDKVALPTAGMPAGLTVVPVSYHENGVYKRAEIPGFTVLPSKLLNITIRTLPDKMNYIVGERFRSAGLTVSANYDSGISQTLTDEFTLSPVLSESGHLSYADKKITVSYGGTTVDILLKVGVLGCVSGSDTLNIADARMVLQHLVGKNLLSEAELNIADVDGRDGVNITDARLILQRLVDKIDEFPRESDIYWENLFEY
ncbi:MAG: hypothetical protein FWE80_04540 [Oscillospiraceae bacterium]|nr:hypothetical protein [Oscillospiraceae bacterium]